MTDKPWICPKCGRVYGPIMPSCGPCNSAIVNADAAERIRAILQEQSNDRNALLDVGFTSGASDAASTTTGRSFDK